jgi:hypothetical protein
VEGSVRLAGGVRIFLFLTTFMVVLKPTDPVCSRYSGLFPGESSDRNEKLSVHLHQFTSLSRMHIALSPFSPPPPTFWHGADLPTNSRC